MKIPLVAALTLLALTAPMVARAQQPPIIDRQGRQRTRQQPRDPRDGRRVGAMARRR